MTKVITIELGEDSYKKIKSCAKADRRTAAKFLENAALIYAENTAFIDEIESQ